MSPLSQMSTNLLDWAFVAIIFSCGRYKEVPSCHVINRNLEFFSSNSHDCKVWLLLSLNWEDLKVVKRRISYSNAKPILRTLSLLPNVGSEIYYCFSIRILSSFSKKCEILECYCYEMLSQLHRYWNKHWRLRKQGFDQSNPIFICDWIQEWQSPHLRYSP